MWSFYEYVGAGPFSYIQECQIQISHSVDNRTISSYMFETDNDG